VPGVIIISTAMILTRDEKEIFIGPWALRILKHDAVATTTILGAFQSVIAGLRTLVHCAIVHQ